MNNKLMLVISMLVVTQGSLIAIEADFPLHVAASFGSSEHVQQLLRLGADVNELNSGDQTPLLCAARQGNWRTVPTLIGAGADVNVQDSYGNTPLHLAALYGYLPIVQDLLNAPRINVLLRNNEGQAPQQVALINNHQEIAQLVRDKINERQAARRNIEVLLGAQHPRTGAQSPARDLNQATYENIYKWTW